MKDYDPSKTTTYIIYLDANNFYGWAMSQKLPYDGMRWVLEEEFPNWRDIRGLYEVNLKYPRELGDLHNDYQLAPEKVKVRKVQKLIPNLNDKERYVVHETLKFYLDNGPELTKIHRGIAFNESAWMKSYIRLEHQSQSSSY